MYSSPAGGYKVGKVFVALAGYDYEGEAVFGVFTTKELAQKHLDTIDSKYFDSRMIHEYELDVGESYPG